MEMTGKMCKVWNAKLKKSVLAYSFKELMFEGSRKLNIETETIKAFLEDGTEIDDEEVYQALPAGVVIYLLADKDKKPWDAVRHGNEISTCHSSFPSTSHLFLMDGSHDVNRKEIIKPWDAVRHGNEISTYHCSFPTTSHSFLMDGSHDVNRKEIIKPCDEVRHENEISTCHCSFPSTSHCTPQKVQQAVSEWSSSLTIPTSSFSASLRKDVETGDLSWVTKSELLGVICEEMEKYTFFPTVSQRDAVARQLIKQFPKLKSNIGEGHEGWSLKIYDRMKNNLRKANIFPHKRKVDSEKSMLKHSTKLKYPRIIPRVLEKGDKIVEEAKNMMSVEMKKIPSTRDMVAMEVGLEASFIDRKRLIESNIPLDDLQKEYPALFTVFGIAYDFNTVHKIDLQKTVLMSLHACTSAVLEYAEKKKKISLPTPLKEADNNVNNLLVMTTTTIPEILGENPEFLYKKYPVEFEINQLKETPITPHICVIGDPFFSSEIYIVAENKILIECCDFLEGIATLIGLYFVANIEYPKQATATYKFFQSYILKLPCKNLPGKLITFCKALP